MFDEARIRFFPYRNKLIYGALIGLCLFAVGLGAAYIGIATNTISLNESMRMTDEIMVTVIEP